MSTNKIVLNPDDKPFVNAEWRVQIGVFSSIDCIVFADCEQDAIDVIIDHYEDKPFDYFLSQSEVQEMIDNNTDWELENYIYGGNHCRYMNFGEP